MSKSKRNSGLRFQPAGGSRTPQIPTGKKQRLRIERLADRLQAEGRLVYERWWLDPRYQYGMVPFRSLGLPPEEIERLCLEARKQFYAYGSIARRSLDFQVNSRSFFSWATFFTANLMMRREVQQRQHLPLGDADDHSALIPVGPGVVPASVLAGGPD